MKFSLSQEQYAEIEKKINLTGDEDYAVLLQKRHGKATYGVHVFERQPSAKEMAKYEEFASRVKYRGTKAEVEGSIVNATVYLYNLLIARAYDVQVGRKMYETLDRSQSASVVPVGTKREAIREFLSNVVGLTSLAEDEGDEEQSGQFAEDE